jgi:hypothetical protein
MAFYRPDVSFVGSETAQSTLQKGLVSPFGTWTVRFGARFSF